jgi:hypothetical protein
MVGSLSGDMLNTGDVHPADDIPEILWPKGNEGQKRDKAITKMFRKTQTTEASGSFILMLTDLPSSSVPH